MNCSNCQNPIEPGEKFCGKCGAETDQSILNNDKKISMNNQKKAVITLWLGIAGVLLSFFPLFALVIAPITLLLGFKGFRSSKKKLAVFGIILALFSLALMLVNWKNSFCQNIFNLTDSCPRMCDLGMSEGGLDGRGPMYLRYSCDYISGPRNIFEAVSDKIDLISGNSPNF